MKNSAPTVAFNVKYSPAISRSDACLLWTFSTAMMKSSSVVVLSSSGRLGFREEELLRVLTSARALSHLEKERVDRGLHSAPPAVVGGP